jgi:hypothetical protein
MSKSIKEIALELKNSNSAKFFEMLPQLCFGIFVESVYGGELAEKVKDEILSEIDRPVNPNSLLLGTLIYKLGNKIYKGKLDDKGGEENK